MDQKAKSPPENEFHPLELLFKRHMSNQWPCSMCNQDFVQYKDLYLHMEKNEHVNVEPTPELKLFYKRLALKQKKSFKRKAANPFTESRKKVTIEFKAKQKKEEKKDLSVVTCPVKSPVFSETSSKKLVESFINNNQMLPSSSTTSPSNKSQSTFLTIFVDCFICDEILDSVEELDDHLLEVHNHKKALCIVPECYASYDDW